MRPSGMSQFGGGSLDTRQGVQDLVGHAFAEVFLVLRGAQVFERKDGDRSGVIVPGFDVESHVFTRH